MSILLQLIEVALLPVILSVVCYLAKRITPFSKVNDKAREVIIGVLFGIAACIGTLWGVDVGGATANARDAAPICAGLLFGPYAGIIAGAIGGIHRWVAVYYGAAGAYSQLACSVSTFLAGVLASALRLYMFDNLRPRAAISGVIALVMEVIHLTILLLTKMEDPRKAFEIIQILGLPMISANAASVFFAVLIVGLLSKHIHHTTGWGRTIMSRVQSYLMVAIIVAFLGSSSFVYLIQTFTATNNAQGIMEANISDVEEEINQVADQKFLETTQKLAIEYKNEGRASRQFDKYKLKYGFEEINIIDQDGIIRKSSEPAYITFNMYTGGEQSLDFMANLVTYGKYVQKYQNNSYASNDSSRARKYAGIKVDDYEYLQVGYSLKQFQNSLVEQIGDIVKNRRIGQNGYLIITNEYSRLLADLSGNKSFTLRDTGLDIETMPIGKVFKATVYDVPSYCYAKYSEGYYVIGIMSQAEIFESRDTGVYINSFMQIICYFVLFLLIFGLVRLLVVRDIKKINKSLALIADGKMDERINITSSEEMEHLSGYINNAVAALEGYIEEAEHRMEKDLATAKTIQSSALPSIFPPYPDEKSFDIYATMNTAKEVGGDFYDFYMLGEDKLVFLIADVSGKGVPAAMFMMRAKALIKNYMETGRKVEDAFTDANASLCEGNDAGMFVTAWMGCLDLKTGLITYANAGHNPPLVYNHETGRYEYLMGRAGFVLAGMDGVHYKPQEIQLQPGDRIYLYTDGVTEATDLNKELYGEDRLLNFMNQNPTADVYEVLKSIQVDIDAFVGEAEQFDDITMVIVNYKEKKA